MPSTRLSFWHQSDPLPEYVVLRNLDRELATAGIDVDASPYPGEDKKKKKKKEARNKRVQGIMSIYRVLQPLNYLTVHKTHILL